MKILYLESYWGGSHRVAAECLAQQLRERGHQIVFCTLPDRFWKWRMRAASFDFLKQLEDGARQVEKSLSEYLQGFDLIFVSALCDVAQLKGFLPSCLPILAYFHENQLGYPQPSDSADTKKNANYQEERVPNRKIDFHFGLTNISSALAADAVVFNSDFQRRQFLGGIKPFLQALPDKRPVWAVKRLAAKSQTLYLGVEDVFFEQARVQEILWGEDADGASGAKGPIIVWNHRWEFDKQPQVFFAALHLLKAGGQAFRLVVLGENFQVHPQVFEQARKEFAAEILHWGYLDSRQDYLQWLGRCHIVVSCAIQENFGLGVLEAMAAGAWPLLPKRLSYCELYQNPHLQGKIFYLGEAEGLCAALEQYCQDPPSAAQRFQLVRDLERFRWSRRILDFESCFQDLISSACID